MSFRLYISVAAATVFTTLPAAAQPLPPDTAAAAEPAPTYEFLYVDANIDASSGGHTALKFGETVYHYQMFDDGIFRLVRDEWGRFRRLYNDLENRSIHVATIAVSPEELRRMQDEFARRFVLQSRRLELYADLRREERLFRALAGEERDELRLRGLGFFAHQQTGDAIGTDLLRAVAVTPEQRAELDHELRDIERRLRALPPLPEPYTPRSDEANAYVRAPKLVSRSYIDALHRRAALRLLVSGAALNEEALLDPAKLAGPSNLSLTSHERKLLETFAKQLERDVARLLRRSAREDSAVPLLLSMARYHAVRRSLANGRLITLDPFPERRTIIPGEYVRTERPLMMQIAARAEDARNRARRSVFRESRGELNPRHYRLYEEHAGRAFEVVRGLQQGAGVRVAPGKLIPMRAAVVALPEGLAADAGGRQRYGEAARLAGRNADAYREHMRKVYDYHLIRKNCATELFHTLNAADEDDGAPPPIVPGRSFQYIPFVSFDLVVERLRPVSVKTLPSYRKRLLARSYDRENGEPDTAIYLRESHTGTATLHEHRRKHTAFLFFTDDVFWGRPLYGLANLGYGLGYATAGVFTAPFDEGERLEAGAKGMLFSFPELVFQNIRKGGYDFVDERQEGD